MTGTCFIVTKSFSFTQYLLFKSLICEKLSIVLQAAVPDEHKSDLGTDVFSTGILVSSSIISQSSPSQASGGGRQDRGGLSPIGSDCPRSWIMSCY